MKKPLSEYLQGYSPLLPAGNYIFTLDDIEVVQPRQRDDGKESYYSLALKGRINGHEYRIYYYMHPNLYWQRAQLLAKLGANLDTLIDLNDEYDVMEALAQFRGCDIEVHAEITYYNGKEKNAFTIIRNLGPREEPAF